MEEAIKRRGIITIDGEEYNLLDANDWELDEEDEDIVTLYYPDFNITFDIVNDLNAEDENKIRQFMDTM